MINFKVIKNLNELPKFIDNAPMFCDIETEKLYKDNRLIQVYQPIIDKDNVYILDLDFINEDEAKEFLKDKMTVWYNASYDLGSLNMTTENVDDLYYLIRLAYPQLEKFNLDYVIEKMRYGNLYKGLDKKKLQRAGFKKGVELSDEQLLYSAIDVYVLSKLWENRLIQKARTIKAYRLDILSLKYAIEYQQNGLIPDRKAIARELEEVNKKIAENEIKLNGLNPNSPKQVKEVLGIDSSSKNVLVKLIAEQNELSELAKLVFEQRRLLKRRTLLESYDYDVVYTKFNVNGAATSRFTSTGGDLENGINAQQIPRDLQYLFQTPTDEFSIIHADFSTAELRAGCSIMNEPVMADELKSGVDLHKAAASLALGKPINKIDKKDRQKGKAISFGFIFGMSATSFVEYAYVNYGVKFTQNEANIIKKKYLQKYKRIAAYHKFWWEHYKDTIAETPLGHRNKPRLGTDAINYATQGCIAETTKIAIIQLVNKDKNALKMIYNVVHDALYLRVPVGEEKYWTKLLVEAMLEAWDIMNKQPMLRIKGIPMGVEFEILRKGSETYVAEVFSKDELKRKLGC